MCAGFRGHKRQLWRAWVRHNHLEKTVLPVHPKALPHKIAGMTFLDQLAHAQSQNQSMLCVGLDPDPARFPASLRGDASSMWPQDSNVPCAPSRSVPFNERRGMWWAKGRRR